MVSLVYKTIRTSVIEALTVKYFYSCVHKTIEVMSSGTLNFSLIRESKYTDNR